MVRLFRLLLLTYPPALRRAHGAEMAAAVAAGWRDRHGLAARCRFLTDLLLDCIASWPREWRRAVFPAPVARPRTSAGRPRWLLEGVMKQDIRFALRMLRKSPGYTAVALLLLALGIGANSAIFAAVDAVLLRPLPYPHADRLYVPVSVNVKRGIPQGSVPFADYDDWRQQRDVFAEVALWRPIAVDVTSDGAEPERIDAAQVSEEFFRLADVSLTAGRQFLPADHDTGAPRVAILTYGFWQRRFGGAPGIVGRTIRISGFPAEVIGVLPKAIWPGEADAQVYLPLRPNAFNADVRTRRDNMIFQALARVRDDVTVAQADDRLAAIAARIAADYPESRKGWTSQLIPLRNYIVEADLRRTLLTLLGAVAAVLLIACANLANLTLLRGTGRVRELGLRVALGARRGQLVRALLTESALLAAAGAALGIICAHWMIKGLAALAPAGTPFVNEMALDGRVLAATVCLAAITMALTGVLPAIAGSAVHLDTALKEGASGSGWSKRSARVRALLVIVEIAIAIVLLCGAGLLIRSFDRIRRVDPGVSVDRVLVARLSLPGARYGQPAVRAAFFDELTSRLTAAPGVEAVAATSYVPAGGGGFGLGRVFLAEGWPDPPASPDVPAQWNVITAGYFRTVGISLLRGRAFDARDRADATPVMIVTRSFARRMFGDADPIGKRARSWRDENVLREIVGVVADVRYQSVIDQERPLVYVPYAQDSWGSMSLVVRSASGAPADLTRALRQNVASIDPNLALARIEPLTAEARASVAEQRYAALLLTLLAGAALALGAIGLYGVMSSVVAMRTRELSLRVALGATSRDLQRLILQQGLTLMIVGVALGLAGALAATRILASLLFETVPTDPLTYLATIGTMTVATVVACLLPARRAAAADPVDALRG